MHVNQSYTLKKNRQEAHTGIIRTTAQGAQVKTFVTNDGREFKFLTFRTYQKKLKLTDCPLRTMETIHVLGGNLNEMSATAYSCQRKETMYTGRSENKNLGKSDF